MLLALIFTGVIPKSTDPGHIINNFKLTDFVIDEEHIEQINSLNIGKHYCWDPNKIV